MNFDMGMQLPWIGMSLILCILLVYAVLSSVNLGIGIVMPLISSPSYREIMMSHRARCDRGNEMWLAFGCGALLLAFPQAAMTLLAALYWPVLIGLLMLLLRKRAESGCFILGSIVATLMQGMIIGSMIQGLALENDQYAGGAFAWVTVFTVFFGLLMVLLYGLVGTTWLIRKTEGELKTRCVQLAQGLLYAWIALLTVIAFSAPWVNKAIALRWFALPNLIYLAPIPIYMLIFTGILIVFLKNKKQQLAFYWALGLLILFLLACVITVWPYLIPYTSTIWQAAAPLSTQSFGLMLVIGGLPLVIGHTVYRNILH